MASQPRYDEGLQVVSNTPVTFAHEGLQVASNTPVIFAHEQQQKQVIEYYGEAPDGKEAVHSAVEEGIYFNDDNGKVNKGKKRICGLSAVTFWLVVVIAVLVITGAVGGGIGGSLAAKNSKNSGSSGNTTVPILQKTPSQEPIPPTTTSSQAHTSSTSTSTSASASPTFTETPDDAGCPQSNGTTITSGGSTFITICDTNIIGISGRPIDLGNPVRAVTLQACVDTCMRWNAENPTDNQCVAVSWAVNLPGVTPTSDWKMCWSKLATSFQDYNPNLTSGLGSASAVLPGA